MGRDASNQTRIPLILCRSIRYKNCVVRGFVGAGCLADEHGGSNACAAVLKGALRSESPPRTHGRHRSLRVGARQSDGSVV